MRALFNIGTPRGLQAEGKAADVLAALARLAQLAAPLRWTALTLLQAIHDAQPLRRGNHHPLATAA